MRQTLLILAATALGTLPARAQAPPPKPQQPSAQAVEGTLTPRPDEPALAAGELHVKAESWEQVEKGHIEARGLVDLNLGGMRIQADKADIYEVTHPDGRQGHRLEAEGNVVFIRGEERLAGEKLEMDDTGHGFLTNALGFVEPGVFVEGRRIERIDDKTYKVEGGRFTSCSQPNARWGFQASSATIEVDDKVKMTNAVFKLKSVPVFYLPYMVYPISHDGRSSGFLFPHFGRSSYRGFNIGSGFFWVMGRSADQTFYADYWSKLGYGYGHELRYVEQSPSRGTFRTYVFDVKGASELDYDLDWNAIQMLPGKVKVALNVRQYSDLQFQQQYQDDFNAATTPDPALVGLDREGPEARRAERQCRHGEHLFRHRLHARRTAVCPASACGASRARSAGARWWSGSRRPPSVCSTGTRRRSTTGRVSTWVPTSHARSR